MYRYPARLKTDTNGTILVTFPDVPEAITFGADPTDAVRRGTEALEAALSIYIDRSRELPKPSALTSKNEILVTLPALDEAKLAVYSAMKRSGVSKAELARRLGWQKSQVTRVLDLNHDSRLDQIEAVLRALGRRLEVRVRDIRERVPA